MKQKKKNKNTEPQLERITVNQSRNSLTINQNQGLIGDADNFNKLSPIAQNTTMEIIQKQQQLKHEIDKGIIKNDAHFIKASRYRIKREADNIRIARLFPFFLSLQE